MLSNRIVCAATEKSVLAFRSLGSIVWAAADRFQTRVDKQKPSEARTAFFESPIVAHVRSRQFSFAFRSSSAEKNETKYRVSISL